jgi:hypothetical protein
MPDPAETGSNPFATRFIRPGMIPYVFPPDVSAASIISQLVAQNWRGSILGPHGSGKSSLLGVLVPELESHGRHVIRQQLQGGERQLRWQELAPSTWNSQTLVVIDGYEQLSFWQRLLLRARCRLKGAGLLVTAHEPVGLAPIFTTQPTEDLAQAIVQQLVPTNDAHIRPADVVQQFAAHKGNVRETLLALYDVYRSRSLTPPSET